MNQTILLIDDDASLLNLLGKYLEKAGYRALRADNGLAGIQTLYDQRPDLVVLDVMMPRLDGWETCRRIRDVSDVPIIMLTAQSDEASTLKGFQMGVDDYVTKPFSFAELTARIGAVLARVSRTDETSEGVLNIGAIVLDRRTRQVTRAGEPVQLSPTEFRLLAYLMDHAGEPLPPATLVTEVWGPAYANDTGYIKRYIWYLRQKIEPDPANPQYILTERGFGYRFAS
ncbi:MAG: response regulator transcription factor [Anaerolineae bacterium]